MRANRLRHQGLASTFLAFPCARNGTSLRAMFLRRILVFLVILTATTPLIADAGDIKSVNTPVVIKDPLSKGNIEVELLGGYFHSPFTTSSGRRPEFDYAGADIRLGIVLTPVLMEHTPLRG